MPSTPGAKPGGSCELELCDAFNIIKARHLDRLLGGELLATSPRLDWSRLMRRTFGKNLLDCPSCGGPMRPIAEITDPTTIRRILDHLAVGATEPRGPPPLATLH